MSLPLMEGGKGRAAALAVFFLRNMLRCAWSLMTKSDSSAAGQCVIGRTPLSASCAITLRGKSAAMAASTNAFSLRFAAAERSLGMETAM